MGIPGSANPMLLAGAAGAYEIDQSLRFNSADSTRLSRTTSGFGITTTCTISWWHKKTAGSTSNTHWMIGTYPSMWSWESTDTSTDGFRWVNKGGTVVGPSGSKYRDYSGWYHWIITQNGTVSKVYLNGVLIKQDNSNSGSSADGWHIGSEGGTDNFLNGYLAEFIFLDGIAVTDATSFGETDTTTGAWIPKEYSGSYGTNGFYLKFDPSATNGIGHDHSGNGNNFTATGFTTSGTGTDVMSDTPTTNYPTWNPINKGPGGTGSYGSQLSDGNLVLAYNKTSGDFYATSTFGLPTTGKWYWEQRLTSTGSSFGLMGIAELNWTWNVSPRVSYLSSGKIWNAVDGSSDAQTSLSTYTTGDVIGHAWDADAGTLQFYKNGTAVGNPQAPTTTTNITFAIAFNAGSDTGWTTVLNCGQRAFEQTPPTGYKALNTANLPEPTIKDGGKYFNTVLYTGNGGTQAVTGVGFQPDMTWIKRRNASAEHWINDAVRGAGYSLPPSNTLAEQNYTTLFTSFDSDGFSLASGTSSFNESASTYVAWNWDAGGAGSSNNAGSITSTVSANASAGFSIVTYTGTGSNASVGHGLGVTLSMCIIKQRNTAQSWWVWHQALGNNVGANNTMLELNGTAGTYAADDVFRGFTSTVFNIGTDSGSNTNGGTYVAYCFSEVASYSKFGSYVGNGSTTDGPFIWCGFTPRWILIKWYKDVSSAESWHIYDTARQTYNANNTILQPDSSGAEETPSDRYIDILSNGFKLRQNGQQINRSGASYIFAAFAELPFKYSTAR